MGRGSTEPGERISLVESSSLRSPGRLFARTGTVFKVSATTVSPNSTSVSLISVSSGAQLEERGFLGIPGLGIPGCTDFVFQGSRVHTVHRRMEAAIGGNCPYVHRFAHRLNLALVDFDNQLGR